MDRLKPSWLVVVIALLLVSPSNVEPVAASHALLRQDMVANQWIEAGSPLPLRGDDSAKNYTLPFPFDFYGTNYTRIWITTNGLISFTGADDSFLNSESALAIKTAIAPLWDDLLTSRGNDTTTNVFVGMVDPDHFLVRWKAVTYASVITGDIVLANFEAILGRDATIRLNYESTNGTVTATAGVSNGAGEYFANEVTSPDNMPSFLYTPVSGSRPVIVFTLTPTSPWLVQETVTFNASASYDPDGSIVLHQWDFGDGTNATTPLATHAYSRSGEYTVTLTLRDDTGFTISQSFSANVGTADARSLDAWPGIRTMTLSYSQNATLNTRAINIGALPVSVRTVYTVTNLKTGGITTLYSPAVALDSRQEAVLTVLFTPSNATARYSIQASFQFTPRDPSSTQPGWIDAGSFYFRIRVRS